MGKNHDTGLLGEDVAAVFLESKGFEVLERRFRTRRGEVDLVCSPPVNKGRRGIDLVFVEVKTRRSRRFGLPESRVSKTKRRRLRRVAQQFLFDRGLAGLSCRIDVVAVNLEKGSEPVVNHIEGAVGLHDFMEFDLDDA